MPINFAARNLELLNGGTTSDILWPVNNIRGVRTEVVGGEIRESVKRKTELPTIGPRSINSHWHPITWGCVRANGLTSYGSSIYWTISESKEKVPSKI